MKSYREYIANKYCHPILFVLTASGGLIFKSQLKKIMGVKHDMQMSRILNELSQAGLIEEIFYKNTTLIRIKRNAFIKTFNSERIPSVRLNPANIKKSIYIYASLLYLFKIIGFIPTKTGVLDPVRLAIIMRSLNFHMLSDGMLSHISSNFYAYDMNSEGLTKWYKGMISNAKNMPDAFKNIARNNMYVYSADVADGKKDLYEVKIAMFDISFMTPQKFAHNIACAINELSAILMNEQKIKDKFTVGYSFTVFSSDQFRTNHINSILEKCWKTHFQNEKIGHLDFSVEVVNLDIPGNFPNLKYFA